MVRDYVQQLYTPAALASRRVINDNAAVEDLADWKAKVRAAWPHVRIEHVESTGVSDSPSLGSTLAVKVYATLGPLSPDELDVQVAHGRVAADDQLRDPDVASLKHAEAYEGGRHRFEAEIDLDHTGPFGYTVRILPKNDLLASSAEVGLVAWPVDVNETGLDA
ncbi:MAG: hypothetical protein WKF73_21525 [Nocardioidaceae bacterium]